MSFKAILFCAQALLIQAISSQCIGAYNGIAEGYGYGSPYEYNSEWSCDRNPWNTAGRMRAAEWENAFEGRYGYGINGGLAPATVAASNGGSLAVTSSSPISPSGVSLISENAIEGPLAVSGEIPFLGAVALEGALPTAGSGGVAYGGGNGNVAILNEDLGYGYGAGFAGAGFAGPEFAGLGFAGPGFAGQGFAGQGFAGQGFAGGFGGYGSPAYGFNRGCGCGAI